MKFWEIYRVVCKRKSMILGLVALTVVIVIASTANRGNVYQATAQVMPSDAVLEKAILWNVRGQESDGGGSAPINRDSQIANLMILVSSRTVAERAVEALGLDMSPDQLKGKVSVDRAPYLMANPEAKKIGPQTDIIRIKVTDTNPDRAVQLANGVAMVFSSYYQELSHENALENSRYIQEEMSRAATTLDDAEMRLKGYKQSHGIAAEPEGVAASVSGMNQMMAQRDQAAAQLAEVRQRLANVRGQLRREAPTTTVQTGTTDSAIVQQLETEVATLRARLVEAQAKYQDIHPVVQDIKKSLDNTQARLDAERGKMKISRNMVANPIYQNLLVQKSQLESDALGYAARVSQLDAAVARTRSGVVTGGDVALARLNQEFLDAQSMVSGLRAKLYQARLDEKDTTSTGAIRIVDRAVTAESPARTSRAVYLAMGLMLSLIFGVGLAVGLESLDNRIRSNTDVEQLLSLPVNALIPSLPGRHAALPTITYIDPLSPVAEAYRFLRTDLLLSAADSGVQSVMVATAKPGQGGTTTVANLAISLAMDGKRVILVDADMRRPQQHMIFKVANTTGLSNVLSGEREVEEVLVSTEIQNLLILPGGPPPLNPSELLGSRRMRDVVARLEEMADFVLYDTPSAVAFTDTIVLTHWVDNVLMVVRANQVPRGAELQVRNLFNKAHVKILGVVLNDVQPTNVDSYYYHSHYYPTGGPRLALEGGKGGEASDNEG